MTWDFLAQVMAGKLLQILRDFLKKKMVGKYVAELNLVKRNTTRDSAMTRTSRLSQVLMIKSSPRTWKGVNSLTVQNGQ